MAIELTEYNWPAKIVKSGAEDDLVIAAGQGIQIRYGTLADPETLLQEQCPAGKAWNVRIIVEIEETDA